MAVTSDREVEERPDAASSPGSPCSRANASKKPRGAMRHENGPFLYLPPGRLDVDAVALGRRGMEQRRAFGRRVRPGEPFERVVQHVIGKGDFVWRKIAF